MQTIQEVVKTEETIKKSLFIGLFIPLENADEVGDALNQVRRDYPMATHYPYAYILGKNQDIFKYYDDGEPARSAGYVIYEVLLRNELTNCLCIVIRFYGGIKLGIGGLSRAYRGSAMKLITTAKLMQVIDWDYLTFICPYEDWSLVESRLRNYELISKSFTSAVKVMIKLPREHRETLTQNLINLTNNRITFI